MPHSALRLVALLLFLGGCSCGGGVETAPPPATASAVSEPGRYEVHEWGLVRGMSGDRLHAGAIGPPPASFPMTVDKPVLYFHTDASLTLRSVRVHASGPILEHWPLTPQTGIASELAWVNVAIDPGSRWCEVGALPTDCGLGESPCEVPSLALVRTPESPCIQVAGATDRMLFYRSSIDGMTPPLLFSRSGSSPSDVVVANEGDEPIAGRLIRIRSVFGQVLTLAVDPPAPHQQIVVGSDFAAAEASDEDGDMPALPGGPEAGRAALQASLTELGLTSQEADAFLRAWDGALFGLAVDGRVAIDSLTADEADGIPAPVDSFVYFLPPSSVEAVSSLELDPPPAALRRAFAMWSIVPPSGSSR